MIEKAVLRDDRVYEQAVKYRDSLLERLRELKKLYDFDLEYDVKNNRYILNVNNAYNIQAEED